MKKILNLGYGMDTLYKIYKEGGYSSQLFYGMIELQEKGYQIEHCSFSRRNKIISIIENTLLILRKKPDILFISYIYESPLMGIALLKMVGLLPYLKIIGIYHKTLKSGKNPIEKLFFKLIYRSFHTICFHSPLNLEESIKKQMIKREHTKLIHWGVDLNYINHFYSPLNSKGNYFVSTGRENRDFSLLIQAFAKLKSPLKLFTNKINYENNYFFLENYQNQYSNIEITFVAKNKNTALEMTRQVANSLAVVIPLHQEACHYCVGHTSIVEAMALGKPIIVSINTYHPIDVEKEKIGLKVGSSLTSWQNAITFLNEHKDIAHQMGKNGRKLAETLYNVKNCSDEIEKIILK